MENNEWIVNYLKGKEVKKVDLKDFFTIQNEEKPITVKVKNNEEITYITDVCSYNVKITLVPPNKTVYVVKDVVPTLL